MRDLKNAAEKLSHRYGALTLAATVIFSLFGFYIYFFHLEITTDRERMTDRDALHNQRYDRYKEKFSFDQNVLILAVQASDSGASSLRPGQNRAAMKRVAAAWAQALRTRPETFSNVIERIDPAELGNQALLYLPYEQLEALVESYRKLLPGIQPFLEDPSIRNLIAAIDAALKESDPDAEKANRDQAANLIFGLETLFRTLDYEIKSERETNGVANGRAPDWAAFSGFGKFDPDGYFFTDDGAMLTVYAQVDGRPDQKNRFQEAVEFARAALDTALANEDSGVEITAGLAGLPALEYEEMKTIHWDFSRGAVITLVLVSGLFIIGFGSILRPALAAVCLVLTIGLTFLFTWVFVGHLNLVAMIFTVVLVALGIDFAIHFTTHYEDALASGLSPKKAIFSTYKTVGGALWMGAITTAAAFFSGWFTEFVGLSELGVIAGGGLLLCLVCMYFVYPVMLYWLDTKFPKLWNFEYLSNRFSLPAPVFLPKKSSSSALVTVICGGMIIFVGLFFGQFQFDTNLLNLQAADSPAGFWQKELIRKDDRALFAIAVFPDRDELEKARTGFENAPGVAMTESLFPFRESEKRALLRKIDSSFDTFKINHAETTSKRALRRELFKLRHTVRKFRAANTQAGSALSPLENQISEFYKTVSATPEEELGANLRRLEGKIHEKIVSGIAEARRYLTPPPVILENAPGLLKKRFVGKDGTLALKIYSSINIWESENLAAFMQSARAVDDRIFGSLVSIFENGQMLVFSFLEAAFYALITILVLVFLWSKSLKETLLTVLPLITGIGVLLAFMRWGPISVSWNFANFFALPILIGVGVDCGVHLVKAWSSGNPRMFFGAVKAVTLSALTTMVGFGVLATSDHMGVSSLGIILFSGIAFILLSALTVLPAALTLFTPASISRNEI